MTDLQIINYLETRYKILDELAVEALETARNTDLDDPLYEFNWDSYGGFKHRADILNSVINEINYLIEKEIKEME